MCAFLPGSKGQKKSIKSFENMHDLLKRLVQENESVSEQQDKLRKTEGGVNDLETQQTFAKVTIH